MNEKNKIRFAPFIRVSTERQERKGESLQVQKIYINESVEKIGGVIPDYCWERYCGHEHATSDQERKKLDMLLNDASKGIFDAVIVYDASRWSRDNKKSKEGLEILRRNNIRFYILSEEQDLFDPEKILFIGMSAEIGEFQARMQVRKSLFSKIERAKKGRLSSGKPPYGRIFKDGKWEIDCNKQRKVKIAIDRYLNGSSIDEASKIIGVCRSQGHYIFSKSLGKDFEIKFDVKRMKINETVKMQIPALVDDETIKKVHDRLQSNKTYNRNGFIKNRYLLNRMIFCDCCGYALTGAEFHGKRYYRHTQRGCKSFGSLPADLIEEKALYELINTVGNQVKIREAAQRAMPDLKRERFLSSGIESMEKNYGDLEKKMKRLIDAIADGTITKAEAQEKILKIRDEQLTLRTNVDTYKAELGSMLTERELDRKIQLRFRQIQGYYTTDLPLKEMSFDDKKRMLQDIFQGKDLNGRRNGIYIKKTESKKWPWVYVVKGILRGTLGGWLPAKVNLVDENNPGNSEDS
jgi:DNA invertase Pin-like site-specific DNA recombinase